MSRLVIMNTWMWPVRGDPHFERFSGLMGGAIGRFLIRRFNFFVRVVMKKASGDPSKLTKPIHRHYLDPLNTPAKRQGCLILPKEIIGSTQWLDALWSKQEMIRDKPTFLLWGMKDIAFREQELLRWEEVFSDSRTIRFDEVGHYVQEELGPELCPPIREFVQGSPGEE